MCMASLCMGMGLDRGCESESLGHPPGLYEEVGSIAEGARMTRVCGLRFNVANVRRPLASASKVAEAGNRVAMEANGGYVENIEWGERIALQKRRGVYMTDVGYGDGSEGEITVDSGAGVSVWPQGWKKRLPIGPPVKKLKMVAANGSEIKHLGAKLIKFRGEDVCRGRKEQNSAPVTSEDFRRPA